MHNDHAHDDSPKTFGIMGEFDNPESIVHAAQKAYGAGYRKLEAYTPFPIHGLAEAVGFKRTWLPVIVLIGGLTGAATGFLMQVIGMTFHYPFEIAGRPLFSWPAFIPITFELGILFAAFSCVFGMLALNGLPQPYNPVFNAKGFERASRDAFFLCIEAVDGKYDEQEVKSFMESLGAKNVQVVEN
ncbi:MAG: hypothetical protein AMXMBFR84_43340 [Candidatus Hydrogenedentota bacterium]